MSHLRPLLCLATLLVFSTVLACSRSTPVAAPATSTGAPAAPAMPEDWMVVSDQDVAAADIEPVATRLGGKIDALRNTAYRVGGKPIQLNTIVAASATDADAIMASLGQVKSDEWCLRRGLIIYEFVGADGVVSEMRDAKSLLTAD